jgi:hypothetical protein
MISYEELCAALEKLTSQRRNEAELSSALGKGDEPAAAAAAPAPAAGRRKAITGALPRNWKEEIDPLDDDARSTSSAGLIELEEVVEE